MNSSYKPNPITRLDQLLSQNQTIYNNLKSRLNEINKSNQNINVNIKNIKPFYENESSRIEHESKSNYHEHESSPIESEYRLEERKQISKRQQSRQTLSPRFKTMGESEQQRRKYTTFENEQIFSEENLEKFPTKTKMKESKFDSRQSRQQHKIVEKQFEKNYSEEQNFYLKQVKHSPKSPKKVQLIEQFRQVDPLYSSLYIPFNKLYRSPILQYKDHHTLLLSRRSKTSIINKSASTLNIIDGIKYKIKNIFTDEQTLLKEIYQGQKNNEILIVGGQNCLKKKLHMSLIAFVCKDIASVIRKKTVGVDIIVKIDHQEIQSSLHEPIIKSTAFQFRDVDTQNNITFLNLQSFLQEIYYIMKKPSITKNSEKDKNYHRLRLTKFIISGFDRDTSKFTIVSTNKYEAQFVKSLNIEKVIWCINPLVKYYDSTKKTLQAIKAYSSKQVVERKTFLNF